MKKSQLLKIIKESIKELQRSNLIIEQDTAPDMEPGMNKVSRRSLSDVAPVDDQSDGASQQPQAMASQNIPGKMCSLRRCNGPGYTHGGICIPNSIPNSVGDGVILVHLQGPPGIPNYVTYYGHTNKPWFIKTSGAACNAVYNGVPIQVNAYNSFGNQYGNNVNSNYNYIDIYVTTDNSSYAGMGNTTAGAVYSGTNVRSGFSITTYVDVTDTSLVKFRIYGFVYDTGVYLDGITIIAKKIGDT